MSNGFEALAPLADKLKTQARKQEAEREANIIPNISYKIEF